MVLDNNKDFSDCKFINSEMKFYVFDDFYNMAWGIKRLFKTKLSKDGKQFYMWYVYSNTHISTNQKNAIWDFLNDFINYEQLRNHKTKRS